MQLLDDAQMRLDDARAAVRQASSPPHLQPRKQTMNASATQANNGYNTRSAHARIRASTTQTCLVTIWDGNAKSEGAPNNTAHRLAQSRQPGTLLVRRFPSPHAPPLRCAVSLPRGHPQSRQGSHRPPDAWPAGLAPLSSLTPPTVLTRICRSRTLPWHRLGYVPRSRNHPFPPPLICITELLPIRCSRFCSLASRNSESLDSAPLEGVPEPPFLLSSLRYLTLTV